ncbi:MAG: hypothetical protein E6Q97_08265 [Desulfurellales bacterium]|nr:MAG: hypothetical protein E6Q97_08265 [Desulfurellales bacterium]
MHLIATYDMHYGRKGPYDTEAPLVLRGEDFEVLPTSQASSDEVARFMVRNGTAVTPEIWAKRKPISDLNWRWAQDETAKNRAAYQNRKTARGG